MSFKDLCLVLTTLMFTSLVAQAEITEGAFRGKSTLIKNKLIDADFMALLIQKDPKHANRYYAFLAEYDVVPGTFITITTAITKWINRMYAYQLDKLSNDVYIMRKLRVSADGEIYADMQEIPDTLRLSQTKGEFMKGTILTRFNKQTKQVEEVINIVGRGHSTWEKFVPGVYFGSTDSTGGDYFHEEVNTEITHEGRALFNMPGIIGEYQMSEQAPKMFTFKSMNEGNVGQEKLAGRIGVFIDIVNWKAAGFTTDELLVINPDNASDVGFYYERELSGDSYEQGDIQIPAYETTTTEPNDTQYISD